MRRWVFASLVAVVGAGVTVGQEPGGETIRMRTAGQPDRILKVVKIDRTADGHVLVDVKDVKSGDAFTLMDPSFLSQMKSTPVSAPRTPPPAVTTEPPLASRPVLRAPQPIADIPPVPVPVVSKPAAVALPAASTPAPAKPISAPAQPIPGRLPVLTPALPASLPASPNPATTIRPAVPAEPAMAPVQPASVARMEPARASVQSTLQPQATWQGVDPATVQMGREIGPWVADLTRAIRPSIRMDAATALAEGRYGWRDEVKAYLARAATTDPAPVVRAHCISLLAKLGYATAEHRSFLATCAADRHPDVRVAATIALSRLETR